MTGSWSRLAPLAFLLPVLLLFGEVLTGGRVLYFRDVCLVYLPDYAFVERALRAGVWPLWNSASDGGVPFLKAYPPELLLPWAVGARATLALLPPLHVLLGMWGMFRLGRDLGVSAAGAWLSGAGFGLSGLVLSSLLYPDFLAAAWAPWTLLLVRSVVDRPSRAKVVGLAACVALQISTLGATVVIQTAVAALVLLPRRPSRATWLRLSGAAVLALMLAAPAWVGVLHMLRGTERAAGFDASVALSYSASAPVLVEAVWPRLFGDPHTMTASGYWGQPFYPGGHPFYTGLYLGPAVVLLALAGLAWSGFRHGLLEVRLAGLAVLGLLLSLGEHGPAAGLLSSLSFLRVPAKFFFLTTLATCLLAGRGFDRLLGSPARAHWGLVAAGPMLLLAGVAWLAPDPLASAVASVFEGVDVERVREVVAACWPGELFATGALLVAGIAALGLPGLRRWPLVPVLVALDLLRVNLPLVPLADASFYELRPASQALAARSASVDGARMYSFGVANSPPLRWDPSVLERDHDVWLFYLDRQSLLARTHVLDGLESAFDIDRIGWAPPGSTFGVQEANARHYRALHDRLRLAAVRWVLSFHPLPEDLVVQRETARLPEVAQPLRLYELREPLARARLVSRSDQASGPGDAGRVRFERHGPHEVTIEASGPAGYVVVSEGWDPAWQASDASGRRVPLHRAGLRYWGLEKTEGTQRWSVAFRPGWRPWALGALLAGAIASIVLLLGAVMRPTRGPTNA